MKKARFIINTSGQPKTDKSQFLDVKINCLTIACSYSKEDQFLFFPTIGAVEGQLFGRGLCNESKMLVRLSGIKGKLKFPAAHNIKLSVINSIISFEIGNFSGFAKEQSLMSMCEFFFKLFLIKRLRRYHRHLKNPEENARVFTDVFLGPDIVKLVV